MHRTFLLELVQEKCLSWEDATGEAGQVAKERTRMVVNASSPSILNVYASRASNHIMDNTVMRATKSLTGLQWGGKETNQYRKELERKKKKITLGPYGLNDGLSPQ